MNANKQKLGYLKGFLSSIVNVGLFGLKLWVGLSAGSSAMLADARQTLLDTLTSVIVIFGFWLAGKPKDKEHPFGHGRAELIGAIVMGTLLAIAGLNFLKESYFQLKHAKSVQFGNFSIIVFASSVLIKEALARFSIWAGKKIESKALIADGWHHRCDAIASVLIVIGALLGKYLWWIDGVLGIIVSLLILYAAYEIIRGAAYVLLGDSADNELKRNINNIIGRVEPEAYRMHHIHIHRYGDHIEAILHIKLTKNYSLKKAHDITTTIENALKNNLNIETTIHIEPID